MVETLESPPRPKIGLALGSGVARGWAHLGPFFQSGAHLFPASQTKGDHLSRNRAAGIGAGGRFSRRPYRTHRRGGRRSGEGLRPVAEAQGM